MNLNNIKSIASSPPYEWRISATRTECKLHQLSPFIGKLKSTIANDLIKTYSKSGDLIIDPFSGSGTIPLEAWQTGRDSIASDISEYSRILTIGKLCPPRTLEEALTSIKAIHIAVENLPAPDLRKVPKFVRSFFHPETLKEAIKWATILRQSGNEFYFSCFLGILHHQRPGFLSYPSSHLVPYLRTKKYPIDTYPEMYEYRAVYPRLKAKIERALKEGYIDNKHKFKFISSSVENLTLTEQIDCIITSPPYMNALDYQRDNRLRLWFISPSKETLNRQETTRKASSFEKCIRAVFDLAAHHLKNRGFCVLVIGEINSGSHIQSVLRRISEQSIDKKSLLTLQDIIIDHVPDIRRARRNCNRVRQEFVFVYQKR